MDFEQITIKELSSSPYGFRKPLHRRRSLSEFDPKLGNDIQNLLKSAERNSAVGPDAEKMAAIGNQIPIFNKIAIESSQHSTEQRTKNITEAIEWVRTELKSLKEQDKSLMRQFLDLRNSINQFREEIDPFDDMNYYSPKRSMSMLDHLNQEKRTSRYALARQLIEDINTLDEMDITDSEGEDDGSAAEPAGAVGTAQESDKSQDSSLFRGRPNTPSVSVAAKAARPSSVVVRGRPHTPSVTKAAHSSGRPVSDSARFTKGDHRGLASGGIPLIRLENMEVAETEDTKL